MSNTILISGSNSFIARNIVNSNIFKNYKFILLTTNIKKCKRNYYNSKNKAIKIIAYKDLEKKINPDIFIHLAISYDKSVKYNLNFTIKLLNSINLNNTKIIFLSSGAVYGDYEIFEKKNEMYPLNGNDKYAKTKILSEKYLLKFCNLTKCQLFIIRCFPIIGEGLEKKFFLSNFQNKKIKSIKFNTDLNNYRSFANVKNLIKLLFKLSKSAKKIDIINFGSSKHYKLFKFAKYLSTQKKIKFFLGSKKDKNYKKYYLCDNTKIKDDYKINPDLNFKKITQFFL